MNEFNDLLYLDGEILGFKIMVDSVALEFTYPTDINEFLKKEFQDENLIWLKNEMVENKIYY